MGNDWEPSLARARALMGRNWQLERDEGMMIRGWEGEVTRMMCDCGEATRLTHDEEKRGI